MTGFPSIKCREHMTANLPDAVTFGQGFCWLTDTGQLQYSNGAVWTGVGGAVSQTSNGVQNLVAGDISSITWTGTTAPSSTLVATYSWQQVGNMVTMLVALSYATAGTALTALAMNLPAGAPAPKLMGAGSAANVVVAPITAVWSKTNDSTVGAAAVSFLSVNAGANGYTINATSASASLKNFYAELIYETGI